MATVMQAYRFALDPTPCQQGSLASHTGAARFAYNWGLKLVTTRLDQRKTDPSTQVPWTLPDLRLECNRGKQQVAPWWAENSKEAYNSGLDALARALKNWSDSRNDRRRGPRWVSHDGSGRGARGSPAGSPPAPSASSRTANTFSSPALGF
jgi:putative transposase